MRANYSLNIMCLNIETSNNHYFPFGINGKVVVLGVPIFKHFRVFLKSKGTDIQSTLVITKLKGPFETLRDICSSTYQIFRIEENTNRINKFHK